LIHIHFWGLKKDVDFGKQDSQDYYKQISIYTLSRSKIRVVNMVFFKGKEAIQSVAAVMQDESRKEARRPSVSLKALTHFLELNLKR